MWRVKATVVPTVIGVLGVVPPEFILISVQHLGIETASAFRWKSYVVSLCFRLQQQVYFLHRKKVWNGAEGNVVYITGFFRARFTICPYGLLL